MPIGKGGMAAFLLGIAVLLAGGAVLVVTGGDEVGVRSAGASCPGARDCLPEIAGTTLDGKPVTTADLVGKVVLVNFWATWCPPCVKELPVLEAAWKKHGDEGFVVLGMLTADTASDDEARAFAATAGVTYPVLRARGALEAGFGYPTAFPTTFLYGRDGKLVTRWSGELSTQRLGSKLEPLFTTTP